MDVMYPFDNFNGLLSVRDIVCVPFSSLITYALSCDNFTTWSPSFTSHDGNIYSFVCHIYQYTPMHMTFIQSNKALNEWNITHPMNEYTCSHHSYIQIIHRLSSMNHTLSFNGVMHSPPLGWMTSIGTISDPLTSVALPKLSMNGQSPMFLSGRINLIENMRTSSTCQSIESIWSTRFTHQSIQYQGTNQPNQ